MCRTVTLYILLAENCENMKLEASILCLLFAQLCLMFSGCKMSSVIKLMAKKFKQLLPVAYSLSTARTNNWKVGQKFKACQCFPWWSNNPRLNNVFICHVSTVPSQNYAWPFLNDVESCRTMTLLDRKSNEAWNQYVQSCLTRGMLGNGVSGVLWSCFNHRDFGLSPHKQAAYCKNTASPSVACTSVETYSARETNHASVSLYLHGKEPVCLCISVWI